VHLNRDLVSMHHLSLEYALINGYSYQRWKKVVNIMIEKEPGNPKIHRLRVIHLYEADYNLVLGIKWRQLVHHCEDNKLLHPSLYGARPGRGALEPVFAFPASQSSKTQKMLPPATIALSQDSATSPADHTDLTEP
jgi:hypothetical protein